MQELLCTRVHRAVAHTELDDQSYNRTTRLIILYSCRFIGSRDYRKAVKWVFPHNKKIRTGLMDLKDDLDYSIYKNDLYRAAHYLCTQPKCTIEAMKAASKIYKIEVEDLLLLKKLLSIAEKRTIAALPAAPGTYSKQQVAALIKHIDPITRNIVFRQLAFIFNHDPMMEGADDLIEQLRTQAIKVIREYEVANITEDHMIKNTVVSVQNHAVNIAESFGRSKRQPLMRTSKRDTFREVWYLNIHDFAITQVKVSPNPKLRIQKGDNLYVMVQDCETDDVLLVQCKRLYETQCEAETAASLRKAGKYSKRKRYVDLSPQSFDEFQQTCISIDTALDEESVPLIQKIPDELASADLSADTTDESKHLVNRLTPRLREFADIILNPEGNDFFIEWSDKTNKIFSSTELKRLGKAACDYIGISKPKLKMELKLTSANLWSQEARNLIVR